MITRKWTAPVPQDKRDAYIAYIMQTGFSEYKETPGNLGAFLQLRDEAGLTYFTAMTFWDSYDSIKAFAGDDYTLAKYYPKDDAFLTEKPKYVEHEEIVYAACKNIFLAPDTN